MLFRSVKSSTYGSIKSSWTYNGKDISFLNGEPGFIAKASRIIDVFLGKPAKYIKINKSQIRNSTNLEEARIKVENSNSKILIFYGDDDAISDVKQSSKVIKEHTKNEIIIHGYENVGHGVGGPNIDKMNDIIIHLGGNIDSNIEAELDSKRIMLEVLGLWH